MRVLLVALMALFGALATTLAEADTADAGWTQTGRYTMVDPVPEPSALNPLGVVATITFPRSHVQTVGEAVHYLLARTGYQLVDPQRLDDPARALLQLPLPESQRQLGPYRVDSMLQVLLGEPWRLDIDRLTRVVSFSAPSTTAAHTAAAPTAAVATAAAARP